MEKRWRWRQQKVNKKKVLIYLFIQSLSTKLYKRLLLGERAKELTAEGLGRGARARKTGQGDRFRGCRDCLRRARASSDQSSVSFSRPLPAYLRHHAQSVGEIESAPNIRNETLIMSGSDSHQPPWGEKKIPLHQAVQISRTNLGGKEDQSAAQAQPRNRSFTIL